MAVPDGTVGTSCAESVSITSTGECFNGVYVTDGGSYSLTDPTVTFTGNGRCDFVGYGAAFVATGSGSSLVLDGATIANTGAVRTAVVADDGATAVVKNSTITTKKGTLPDDYVPTVYPIHMMCAPWMLGISGNVHATNLLGSSSTAACINSSVYSEGWGALSTDEGSDCTLAAVNCEYGNTGEDGYGSYVTETILGCTLDVGTYAAILKKGTIVYGDSTASAVSTLNDDLDLGLTSTELAAGPGTRGVIMKALTVTAFGAPPLLSDDVPEPTAGPGQVAVRVQSSSVNWLDAGIAHGMFQDLTPHELPVTLGRDFAGVVEATGAGVHTVGVGDEVFGEVPMGLTICDGAWAELIATGAHTLTRKPAEVDTVTVGVAALAATTAFVCVDALDLKPGDTLLVIGATGGVGSIAVQLARAAGAIVLAPGLPEDEEYLRGLGVREVLPREGDVVAAVRAHRPDGVDALVDAVTAYEITPYAELVKDGGRIASPTDAAGYGPGRTDVMHGHCPEILGRVARHLADGTITVDVQRTYDLTEAAEALQALAAHHTCGKIALRVASHPLMEQS